MDALSSSNAAMNFDVNKADCVVANGDNCKSSGSAGGRKSETIVAGAVVMVISDNEMEEDLEVELVEKEELEDSDDDDDFDFEEEESDDDDDSDDEEEEEDDFDDEVEEGLLERRRILEDAKKLKALAGFFMHPEQPIKADEYGTACARSFFDRPSLLDDDDEDMDEEERAQILAEAHAMKTNAGFFGHPERSVHVDATACARNFFSQPWSEPQESLRATKERAMALEDAKNLGQQAALFQHPEAPLKVDGMASGRNYFQRFSGADETNDDEEDEKDLIFQELQALKQSAVDFMHPEKPVVAQDGTLFGRNYFGRASAEDQEDDDEADEKELIMEELAKLKQAAVQYRHPELPLEVDAAAFGRNYYSRPSAEAQDSTAESRERQRILKEMALLKQTAVQYMHPEKPLAVDATATGRNYFSRPSAEEQMQDDEERNLILADAAKLKQQAVDYMHPERPISVDPTAFGRSYFTRPSAEEQIEEDDDEERDLVLADMAALKATAVDYMHPERPISVDPTAFGRNYYSRASGPEDDSEEEQERAQILQEAAQLKKLASDYLHPEKPVDVDPTCFGRNYYDRFSASEQEDDDLLDAREDVLADMALLKKTAADFMHPERPIAMDPTCFGRNYYDRFSASEQETFGKAEARAHILAEAAALKKSAVAFAHPELPIATDGTACARNFFTRPSAPIDEMEGERELVVEDAVRLWKLAVDFLHPEKPLEVDSTASARNYFSRASASEQEPIEEVKERARVLAEAKALEKLAIDYRHPEVALKTTDPAAFGRNYFGRATAAGVAEHISSSGYANPTEDYHSHAEEHSHHDEYGHFDMDEELFYDMRQTLVIPGVAATVPKMQSSKLSSDEEGELSRSPSSVMLFTGALEDANHPPLPSMG